MGIRLHVSNSLRPLAVQMASDLTNVYDADAFTPQWIVTQTEGMNSWLRQKLAKENTIAANIRFQKPNDIVNRLYYYVDNSKLNAIDSETLQWTLFDLLSTDAFKDRYQEIAAYYMDNPIRQIAFAAELADIFDQYQVYRFEIIESWNKHWINGEEGNDWQSWLWIASKQRLCEKFRDKTEIAAIILNRLEHPDVQEHIRTRIPALHFFGIAVINPYYLRIFHALAPYIDIHFYLINPAPEDYWLEDKSEIQIARLRNKRIDPSSIRVGHDLLHNWGRIIKESFLLLFDNDDFVNNYDVLLENTPAPSTLLAKIQDDIFANERRNALTDADLQDGSLTVNGCYTPVREVETLYNYLVDLVEKRKQDISPREILVLVTDIDLYAPYIKAVFQHAPYRFPITIADETITADNNMFSALQDILSLDANFFKAEEVLQLLESPYIRQRFQFTDVDAVRTAVRQAGIYFSQEGRTEDDTRFVSWAYGLKKILYGICMSGEESYSDDTDTFIPLDSSEGAGALERVKLIHFIQVLQDKLEQRDTYRTISGWANYLMDVMDDMIFASGEREDEDYTTFIQLLEQMVLINDATPAEVSFDVFRHSFLHKLTLEKRAGAFAGAGITFCSMVPMRSIPYKVVAILGMNYDKFPRKDTPLSFSLMSKERKPGDRNVKDNDKHLFLETILSAEEKLYISYISKDVKDGTILPPSSLVDELMDYVARGVDQDTDAFKKAWITEHPLHGFSRKYGQDAALRNYLSEDRYQTGIDVTQTTTSNTIVFDFKTIDLEDFGTFFKNPPKVYLNKQLGIYYRDEEILIPEHELFELDHLDKALIQNALMMVDEQEVNGFIEKEKRSGHLPLKNMGVAAVKAAFEERENLREYIKQETIDIQPTEISIDLEIDGSKLHGKIGSIYDKKLVSICNSNDRLPKLIPDYIRYLCLIAVGKDMEFIFLAKKMKPSRIKAGTLSRDEALETLKKLLVFYKQGHSNYFLFWASAAKEKFKFISEGWEDFMKFYEESNESDFGYDMKNEYLQKAVEHGFFDETNFNVFLENMHTILDPLFALLPHPFEPTPKN